MARFQFSSAFLLAAASLFGLGCALLRPMLFGMQTPVVVIPFAVLWPIGGAMAIVSMPSNRTTQVVLLGVAFLIPFYLALAWWLVVHFS